MAGAAVTCEVGGRRRDKMPQTQRPKALHPCVVGEGQEVCVPAWMCALRVSLCASVSVPVGHGGRWLWAGGACSVTQNWNWRCVPGAAAISRTSCGLSGLLPVPEGPRESWGF